MENVRHPNHYNRDGAMECIEELKIMLSPAEFVGFCKGNILKYRYRAGSKNGDEDIQKSDEYVRILAEYMEGKTWTS